MGMTSNLVTGKRGIARIFNAAPKIKEARAKSYECIADRTAVACGDYDSSGPALAVTIMLSASCIMMIWLLSMCAYSKYRSDKMRRKLMKSMNRISTITAMTNVSYCESPTDQEIAVNDTIMQTPQKVERLSNQQRLQTSF